MFDVRVAMPEVSGHCRTWYGQQNQMRCVRVQQRAETGVTNAGLAPRKPVGKSALMSWTTIRPGILWRVVRRPLSSPEARNSMKIW